MAAKWKTASVDDIKSSKPNAIAMGPFGSRIKTENFVSSGVPVIRGKNLNGERLLEEDYVFLTGSKADELRASNAFAGDIVITHRGTLGQVGIIPKHAQYDRYVVSQSQIKLTVDERIADPYFIFYFLRSRFGQDQLLASTSQTGVPAIAQPTTTLKSVMIPLPPLKEQQAIACILGALDDKIELNRKMKRTLDAIARAIFKSWFVDFDPVHAKTAGEQPPGLNPKIAALFPDEFEDSEVGAIPKGWNVKKLANLMEFSYGKALKASNRREGAIPVYGSNGQVGWHDEKLVSGPGIVVGRKGNPGVVTWVSTDFFAIDTTFYVVPKSDIKSLLFLFFALQMHDLASLGADSAVPGLNRNIAYMNKQIVPPSPLIEQFEDHASKLFACSQQCNNGSRTLAALRDALLSKLISGELRVPDADRIVGRVV